jgi:hypothetical protein
MARNVIPAIMSINMHPILACELRPGARYSVTSRLALARSAEGREGAPARQLLAMATLKA